MSNPQRTEAALRAELEQQYKTNRRDLRAELKEIFPGATNAQLLKAIEAAKQFSAAEDRRWGNFNSDLDELHGVEY